MLKFNKNIKGTAAVEFAILFPFLLIMFFGAFEIARYVLVVRRIENTVNDVTFLLSREGTIHDIDGDGVINSASEDAERIKRITAAVVPILMAPYKTDNYQIEIRSVARPVGASIEPDRARLMWSHKITRHAVGAANPAEVSPSDGFLFTQSTSDVSGATKASTIYSDNFGDRAELVFPGQTFLLANFAYGYNQIINNFVNYISLNFEQNQDIEKISSYAVRSRWIDDGDAIIQANEFYNQMQTCTTCNTYSSDNLGGEVGPDCVADVAASDHPETSGCEFRQLQ